MRFFKIEAERERKRSEPEPHSNCPYCTAGLKLRNSTAYLEHWTDGSCKKRLTSLPDDRPTVVPVDVWWEIKDEWSAYEPRVEDSQSMQLGSDPEMRPLIVFFTAFVPSVIVFVLFHEWSGWIGSFVAMLFALMHAGGMALSPDPVGDDLSIMLWGVLLAPIAFWLVVCLLVVFAVVWIVLQAVLIA